MLKAPENFKGLLSVSEVVRLFKLQPNKKLGQNFLLDSFVTDQIVLSCGNLKGKVVLEVGPGPGGLTRSILSSEARKIYAIEMDKRCVEALAEIKDRSEDRLEILEADAVTFDESSLKEDKLFIIANLPYNIGTRLLLKWLERPELYEAIVIMLQKEVVDRIIANPSSKDYGRLSVICQLLCDVDKIMDVDSHFFFPSPKVTSSVVRLVPRKDMRFKFKMEQLSKILEQGFSQRRKMIRSSLGKFYKAEDFASLGIEPTKRIEDLTVEQLCALSMYAGR